ncbi:VWA domain-containing protein [Amycolatopsis acidicola]|uniref:VWA domain-containing protein n=1 Tax=Amycolatopsis acidicola TaxID=2596893 RepID=A0A5N0UP14_9PSEU|nr:VWA domain-containing protein [Amycolatopsis acidicola]KAA9152219.1 VWA domain-containing protein [Amycolatopsis acidicola]
MRPKGKAPKSGGVPRRSIPALLAGLVAVVGVGFAPAAHAAGAGGPAPVMLVLDGSGSMQAKAGAGTKMDAAKSAVHQLVGELPDSARLGLEVYGTRTGSSDAEKTAGCQDVSVVHAVGPLDRAGIGNAVDAVQPRGYTPIGQSLRQAADALPQEGPRSIVLVSDGEDTCAPPDPCEVAKELKQRGVDLTVHAVGLGVDDRTRAQLTCIAESTGGTYTDTDTGSLGGVLSQVTTAALRNYQVSGTPVTGSADPGSAPVVRAGQYQDVLGPQETKYYAVDVPAGWSLYASATIAFQRAAESASTQNYETALLGPGGIDCHISDSGLTTHANDGEAIATGVAFHDGDPDAACHGAGRYVLRVTRDGGEDYAHGAALPIELIIGLEPPAGGQQEASETVTYQDPPGADQPVLGSGSFTTATELAASGHYSDVIQHGETLFFKVRLQWGQGLAYRLRYEPLGAGGPGSAQVSTTLFNPARQTVDHEQSGYADQPTTLPEDGALATPAIAYGNRDSSDDSISTAPIPGWYSFSVKLGEAGSSNVTGSPVRLHVDLSLSGAAQSPPPYVGATPAQANGDGIFVAAGGPAVETPGAQPSAGVAAVSSSVAWWWVGGAVVLVLLLGAGGLLWLRRARG